MTGRHSYCHQNDDPMPPLGGRSVPNRNRELTDSKASAASARSAGPVPKYQLFYFGASIFRFFQIFGPLFSVSKNIWILAPPKTVKNDKNLISDRFWLRFWSLCGSLLAPIFSIFHDSPKTFILQQVPSETLILTSQTLSFWNKFSIKFWCFSDLVFGHPFFVIFPTWYPKTWFLDPSWDPAGFKMAPKIGQVATKR